MVPSSGPPIPSRAVLEFLRKGVQHDLCRTTLQLSIPCTSPLKLQVLHGQTSKRCLSTSTSTVVARSKKQNQTSAQRAGHLKSVPASSWPPELRQSRHASTSSTKTPRTDSRWYNLLAKLQKGARARSAVHEQIGSNMDDTDAQLFNLSQALARSPAAADLKLRCTEFDANGSVTLVSGEFKKSELIAKYGLLPRDLRKIDSSVLPHILVRPTSILINLLHLRVLIQSDRVLVFDAYGSTDSYTQSVFMYDLEGKLRQKPDPRNTSTYLPYEFRALEAVLISVTSGLEAEFALVRDPVTNVLRALEEDIDRDKLRQLLIHSKKLGTFEQKARLVRDAIDDLLEADDDLAAMYLTERQRIGKPRQEDNHQEVEMLLESYHKICDEIVEISGNLISNIRNTEEVVKAILDANRNQLMLLDLKFSVGTLGLAGGTLIAGLYGMNLSNFIEQTDWGFAGISVSCFVLSGIICMYGMRKLRKVQKVRMWGEGFDPWADSRRARHIGGRGNWRTEAMESAAIEQRMRVLKERGWLPSGHGQGQYQANGQQWQPQPQHQTWTTSTHGGAGASGPVLWPGMEGLGMHKLGGATSGGQVDQETGSGYSSPPTAKSEADQYGLYIHSDVDTVERRMTKDHSTEKNAVSTTDHKPTK